MTTQKKHETGRHPLTIDRTQAVRETRSISELKAMVGQADLKQALKEKAELALEDLQRYLEHRIARGLGWGSIDTASRDADQARRQWEAAVRTLEAKTTEVKPYDQAQATRATLQSQQREAIESHNKNLDRISDLRQRLEQAKRSVGFIGRLLGRHSETETKLQDELAAAEKEREAMEGALDAISKNFWENDKPAYDLMINLGGLQGIERTRRAIEDARAQVEELRTRRDELTRAAQQDGFAPLLAHAEFFRSQLDYPEPLNPANREAVVEVMNQYIDTAIAQGFLNKKPRN